MEEIYKIHTQKLEHFTKELEEIIHTFKSMQNSFDNLPDPDEWRQYKQRIIKLEGKNGNGKLPNHSHEEIDFIKEIFNAIGINKDNYQTELADSLLEYLTRNSKFLELLNNQKGKTNEIIDLESQINKLKSTTISHENKLKELSNIKKSTIDDKIQSFSYQLIRVESQISEIQKMNNDKIENLADDINDKIIKLHNIDNLAELKKEVNKNLKEIEDSINEHKTSIDTISSDNVGFKTELENLIQIKSTLVNGADYEEDKQELMRDLAELKRSFKETHNTIKDNKKDNLDIFQKIKDLDNQFIDVKKNIMELRNLNTQLELSEKSMKELESKQFKFYDEYKDKIKMIDEFDIQISNIQQNISNIRDTIKEQGTEKLTDLNNSLNENSKDIEIINNRLDHYFISRNQLDMILNELRITIDSIKEGNKNAVSKKEFDKTNVQLKTLIYNLKNTLIGGIEELARRIDIKMKDIDNNIEIEFDRKFVKINEPDQDILKYKQLTQILIQEIKDAKVKLKSLEKVIFKFYEIMKHNELT